MSVDRTDYLMFGVDIGGNVNEWGDLEAEVEGAPCRRFDVVNDGMSGQYCIAGKIIATSDPYEGFEMAKIDPAKLDIDRVALAAKVSEAIGHTVRDDEFSLILFTHFH